MLIWATRCSIAAQAVGQAAGGKLAEAGIWVLLNYSLEFYSPRCRWH